MLENPRHLQYNCCCKRAVALFIQPLSILRLVSHSAISWCSEPKLLCTGSSGPRRFCSACHHQKFSSPTGQLRQPHFIQGQLILTPPQLFKSAIFLSFYMELSSEIDFGIYRGLLYLRPASRVQYLQLTPQCHPAGTAPFWSQEVKWSHGKQKARLGVLPRKPLF